MEIAIDHNTTLADITTAKDVGDALEVKYPGWGWMVNVHKGVVTIINARMEEQIKRHTKRNSAYGMTLLMHKDGSASELKARAIRMAGELLERSYMPATGYRGHEITQVDMTR